MIKVLTKIENIFTLIHTYIHTYIHTIILQERRFKFNTRISFDIKKRGDWYYLVSSPGDVYA